VKFDESQYDEMMIMTGDGKVRNTLQHTLQLALQYALQHEMMIILETAR